MREVKRFLSRIIPQAKDVAQSKLVFSCLFSSWCTQSLRNCTLSSFFPCRFPFPAFLRSPVSVCCVPGSEGSRTLWPRGLWVPSLVVLLPSTSFLIPGPGWSHRAGHPWAGTAKSGICAMVIAHPSKTIT